jgi:germination protein YpeB
MGKFEDMRDVIGENIRKSRALKWTATLAVIALIALTAVSVWGYRKNRELQQISIQVQNQYSRSFFDLSGSVDNVQTLLAKSLVTSSNPGTTKMLEEVWREANLAQTNMSQLPVTPPILANTSKFLTQVGDMAFALNNQTMNGKPLNTEQYNSLKKMNGYALSLQKSLHAIEDQINQGKMSWGNIRKVSASGKAANPGMQQMEALDKNFQEYPSLIYDGPFADNVLKTKAVGLSGKNYTAQEAKDIARKFIGDDKVQSISQMNNTDQSDVKTYRFNVVYKNSGKNEGAEIAVTQKGGKVYWLLRNRNIPTAKLDINAAKKVAKTFLDGHGFPNMKDTYYMKNDNMAVIIFAYDLNGVTVYPDMIKVKVALDNGEIIGIDSKGYIYSHTKRNIPTNVISLADARKKVNPKLNILSQGRAIIPTEFKSEIYCYEFKGKLDDQDFLIYINAKTGKEQDVLLIIDTPDGVLTM